MVMVSGKNSKIARMDADPDDVHSMVTSLSTDISLINCLTSSFYVKLLTDRQTDRLLPGKTRPSLADVIA